MVGDEANSLLTPVPTSVVGLTHGRIRTGKEIAVKKIALLAATGLLLVSVLLPGCSGETLEPVLYTFAGGKITIGIAGELDSTAGAMEWAGATLAQDSINHNSGIDIDGVSHILELIPINTGEETVDPTGLTGQSALAAAVNNVSFILGGPDIEAVEAYRDVAMDKGVIFIDCGAGAEALQHSVVDDYRGYRFWFNGAPLNEDFSSRSVVRMLGAIAVRLRQKMGVASGYRLNAVIVADNLPWAYGQVVDIGGLLGSINVTLVHTPYWVDASGNTAEMQSVLTSMASLDPEFIITLFSGDAGVVCDELRAAEVPNAMSVGINVMAQLKSPWIASNLSAPPPGGPPCGYEVVLDNWAEGLNQTSKTAAFLSSFMAYSGGEYPLDTAATYDALFSLKAAIEAVAWYDAEKGEAYAKADDIISWLEDPANARVTTTGLATYYPRPGTTASGKPALSEVQVGSLYDLGSYNTSYTYDPQDWTMPPHTTHDLVYGPGLLTGIGAQWQWDAAAAQWKKVAVWPMDLGDGYDRALTDQYGCWDFAYPGTQELMIPQNVIDHHRP
jgi:ABC-type branched-subunit amino acid transport system substrate-binding protein